MPLEGYSRIISSGVPADLLGVTTRQRVKLRQQIVADRAILPAGLVGRYSYQDFAAAVATKSS